VRRRVLWNHPPRRRLRRTRFGPARLKPRVLWGAPTPTRKPRQTPKPAVRPATVARKAAATRKKTRRGHPVSPATRAKISRALKGKRHPHKGWHGHHRKLSAATRTKISKALKGKHHPHRGHRQSAATRRKISKSLRGRHRRRRRRR